MSATDITTLNAHIGQLSTWVNGANQQFKELNAKFAEQAKELAEIKAKLAAKAASAAKRGTGAKRGGGEEKFPGNLAAYFKKVELPKVLTLPAPVQQIFASKSVEHQNITDETKRKKDIEASTWKAITEVVKNRERDDLHKEVGRYHDELSARFKAGKAAWDAAHPKAAAEVPAGMPQAPNLANPMLPNIAGLSLGPAVPAMPAMPAGLPAMPMGMPTFPTLPK